jgi:hypothetical protein
VESTRLRDTWQQLNRKRIALEAQNGLIYFKMLYSALSANDPFITKVPAIHTIYTS